MTAPAKCPTCGGMGEVKGPPGVDGIRFVAPCRACAGSGLVDAKTSTVVPGEGEAVTLWAYRKRNGDFMYDSNKIDDLDVEMRALPVIQFNAMSAYAKTGEEVEGVLIEANLDDAETTPAETVRALLASANTAKVAADLMRARAERAEALLKECRDHIPLVDPCPDHAIDDKECQPGIERADLLSRLDDALGGAS